MLLGISRTLPVRPSISVLGVALHARTQSMCPHKLVHKRALWRYLYWLRSGSSPACPQTHGEPDGILPSARGVLLSHAKA